MKDGRKEESRVFFSISWVISSTSYMVSAPTGKPQLWFWVSLEDPDFWALIMPLPMVPLALSWEQLPTVATSGILLWIPCSASQSFHFLGNQFSILNSLCWKNLEWFLFFWSESLTDLLQKYTFSSSCFTIPCQDSFI